MSELAYTEAAVIPALVSPSRENIVPRRTIVYETLVDPTVARVAGEKNKGKLFRKYLFKLNRPEEIEFVSIEKYYEPYVVVSGKYFIDYYRKCVYAIKLESEVKEVILLDRTFIPKSPLNSNVGQQSISIEGEERLVKEARAFLVLDRNGEDSNVGGFPSAPSEKNPQALVESFKMYEIPPTMDVDAIRKRIAQRPIEVSRIVNEDFEIDERSVIYAPRFKLTYKCSKIDKQASLEFDGVTARLVTNDENIVSKMAKTVVSTLKSLLNTIKKYSVISGKWLKSRIFKPLSKALKN